MQMTWGNLWIGLQTTPLEVILVIIGVVAVLIGCMCYQGKQIQNLKEESKHGKGIGLSPPLFNKQVGDSPNPNTTPENCG